MVKAVPGNINPSDDFAHKYAGGTNQYGTKGAENPNEFNGYMNDGMAPGAGEGIKSSPMDLMSTPNNPHFGPPTKVGPAAPENFGPPPVNETFSDNKAQFGAPGFEGNRGQNFKAEGPTVDTGANGGEQGAKVGDGANGAGKGDETKGSDKEDKYSYAKVEKMMIDAMLQKAMQNMKIKSPDPSAWK